jgi:hypothetical protein
MLVLMVFTGLAGSFLYYALLLGLATGKLQRNRSNWLRCVGVTAFFVTISITVIAGYFGADRNLWLSGALWPVVALAMHGGYRAVMTITDEVNLKETRNDSRSERNDQ